MTTFDYNYTQKWQNCQEEFGKWLERFSWDWWCTLTFRFEVPHPLNAKKYFLKWINCLGKDICYFMAVESFKSGFGTHIHSLLGNVDSKYSYVEAGQKWWERYGYIKIEKYCQGLGANYYLTKYIVKELCDWDIKV